MIDTTAAVVTRGYLYPTRLVVTRGYMVPGFIYSGIEIDLSERLAVNVVTREQLVTTIELKEQIAEWTW